MSSNGDAKDPSKKADPEVSGDPAKASADPAVDAGDSAEDSADPTVNRGRSRRVTRQRILIVLVVVAVIGGAIALSYSDSNLAEERAGQSSSAVPSGSAEPSSGARDPADPSATTPSGSGTEAPPVETGDADDLPVPLDPVPLDEPADFGDEVSASLVAVEGFQAEGRGVGEISGPALRVTVRLTNGTGAALSVDAVTVQMFFSADLTPAPEISDEQATVFRGSLESGASAEATYSFSIADEVRDDVSITVSYAPGSSIVVFNGPVS